MCAWKCTAVCECVWVCQYVVCLCVCASMCPCSPLCVYVYVFMATQQAGLAGTCVFVCVRVCVNGTDIDRERERESRGAGQRAAPLRGRVLFSRRLHLSSRCHASCWYAHCQSHRARVAQRGAEGHRESVCVCLCVRWCWSGRWLGAGWSSCLVMVIQKDTVV